MCKCCSNVGLKHQIINKYICFIVFSMQGTCLQCGNVIRGSPVHLEQPDSPPKDFCSTVCLNKYQKKEAVNDQKRGNHRIY